MFKRIAATVIVGGVLIGTTMAAAAALQVNGLNSQAGSTTDLVCDNDGVTVSVQGYEANGQTVQNLVVDGIAADCLNHTLGYQIRNGADVEVTKGAVVLEATNIPTLELGIGAIPVEDIVTIAIVINEF